MASVTELNVTLNLDAATVALIGIRELAAPQRKERDAETALGLIHTIAQQALAQCEAEPQPMPGSPEAAIDTVLGVLRRELLRAQWWKVMPPQPEFAHTQLGDEVLVGLVKPLVYTIEYQPGYAEESDARTPASIAFAPHNLTTVRPDVPESPPADDPFTRYARKLED